MDYFDNYSTRKWDSGLRNISRRCVDAFGIRVHNSVYNRDLRSFQNSLPALKN